MNIKKLIMQLLDRTVELRSTVSISKDATGMIIIKGISFTKLRKRIKDLYGDKRPFKMFIPVYHNKDLEKFYNKEIPSSKMRITEVKVHPFYALEASIIFDDLYERYKYGFYAKVSKYLKENTWLSDTTDNKTYSIDMTNLKNIRYHLKDYQEEFIKEYYNIKNRNKLDGFILSFDQGLGKTLTSVALAECMNKRYIYIVCPNSLKENWANEIKSYYYKYTSSDRLWKDEVYVHGNSKFKVTNNTRFFIVNQESIPKIFPYIHPENNMLIVDESHNFRDMNSLRTNHLYQLKTKLKCRDVLMMSGTPIKGSPSEIAPALRMIDPLFTDDVAKIYSSCFNVSDYNASRIVKQRLSGIIYRRTKEQVLSLPDKYKSDLKLRLKDGSKFILKSVKDDVINLFNRYYAEEINKDKEYHDELIRLVSKYTTSSKEELNRFIQLIDTYVSGGNDKLEMGIHELDNEFLNSYAKDFVLPNINDLETYRHVYSLNKKFISMRQSCMSRALGQILPKYRVEMYNDLFTQNKDTIIKMINECNKKTIIFTSLLGVANHICDELNKSGINTVKIVGESKNRMDIINKFKGDDTIDVLVATTQTLSTGVTLVEASQMFFFGTPWRSADFEQACDRIYRIGQTDNVHIYTVILDTGKAKNLSQRINDILNWSQEMFTSVIDDKML